MTRTGWPAGARAGLTVALLAGMAVDLSGSVNPVDDMLSNAVDTPVGAVLLTVACLGLVGAAVALAVPLRRSPGRFALVALWIAGLLGVALFPTNMPGEVATGLNEVHRYGAVVTVAAPLLLGLSLRDRRLRAVSLLTGALSLGYAVTQGPFASVSLPYEGIAERVVLALLLLVVALIAGVLADPPGPSRYDRVSASPTVTRPGRSTVATTPSVIP